MSALPQDAVILLSYVNTKLRDNYPSFTDFCAEEGVNQADILQKLKTIGYEYDEEKNQFI